MPPELGIEAVFEANCSKNKKKKPISWLDRGGFMMSVIEVMKKMKPREPIARSAEEFVKKHLAPSVPATSLVSGNIFRR